jgi:WD40 repeat protein
MAMGGEPDAGKLPEQPPIPRGLRSRFFGDYEILSELAHGGMGVIYRARQISLNRVVALKMIQPGHLPSPEAWLRFQTEIAASAQLNHPNIVPLHESGTVDGAHFFTMRLMEGGNLATRLAAGRKAGEAATSSATTRTSRDTQGAIIRMMIKVARAVHYAHQRGVLHRDLKPSNILLDDQGEPHVADFGLAKMLANESAATLTDSILGSPNYMAPEQADGRGRNFTVETDVYGLGAILYEGLTGVPPFQARTPVETIRKVLDEEPVPPRKLNPGIDADLETICLKSLQKLPGTRYRSAEEFAADLERWIQGLPILARPVGPLGTVARWSRRHPALAAMSALLVLLLVAGVIGGAFAAMRIRQAERKAVAHLRESLVDQARVLNRTRDLGARSESLRLLREATKLGGDETFRARARDEALAALALSDMDFSAKARVQAGRPEWALIDPDTERLAEVVDGTNLVLRQLGDTRVLHRIALGNSPVVRLEAFSPGGRYLAARLADELVFCDTETGRVLFTTNGATRVFCFATHEPLVVLEELDPDRCEASLRELPSFKEVGRIASSPNPTDGSSRSWSTFSLSPDGEMFLGARLEGRSIELIDVATGRARWRREPTHRAIGFAWQLSKRRLAVAMDDGSFEMWRISDGASNVRVASPSPVRQIALHDGTSYLALAGEDRRLRLYHLNSLRWVFDAPGDGNRLAFDADGTRLATVVRADDTGYFELAKSPQFTERLVASSTTDLERCAFSGDGRFLAIGFFARILLLDAARLELRGGGIIVGQFPVFAFDPLGEEMLSSDANGVSRRTLPSTRTETSGAADPMLVIPTPRWRALAYTTDGRRVWAANIASNRIYAFGREFGPAVASLGPHEATDAVAVSADGQWLASGSSRNRDVKVWHVASGTNAATFHAGRNHRIDFSPDGRWLLAHGDVFTLRDTRTWEPAPALSFPGAKPSLSAAAFSPDGRVLAVVENQFTVRLFDLNTRESIGLLRTLTSGAINMLAFSPDGRYLAAACAQGRLRRWDLSAIRRELAALDLDWKSPAKPAP